MEFNIYFINISKHNKEKIPPTHKHFSEYLNRSSINSFSFHPIVTEEISKLITKMDPKKASFPFSIPKEILVLLKDELSKILTKIFNHLFTSAKFMAQLQTSRGVIPLYKKNVLSKTLRIIDQ